MNTALMCILFPGKNSADSRNLCHSRISRSTYV